MIRKRKKNTKREAKNKKQIIQKNKENKNEKGRLKEKKEKV